jgi:hypothetical protein
MARALKFYLTLVASTFSLSGTAQNLHIGSGTAVHLSSGSSMFVHGQTNINATGSIDGTGAILWFYDAVTNPDRVTLDANSALGIGGSTFFLSNQTNEVLSSLEITSGAQIDIAAGNSLHITGPIANAGTITINANSANGGTYGQLKVDGPYPPGNSGVVSAYQYVPSTGWHLLSSPTSGGFNASTTTLDATKLYGYNGAAWMTQGQNLSTIGAGYIGMVGTGGVLNTSGTFLSQGAPNTSVNFSLNYLSNSAAGGSGSGWNLVGNPFTCNLDFSALKNSNSGISNAYYVWDPTAASGAGVYKYYAANAISGQYLDASATLSGTIPPFQGFWVQTASSGQTLAFSMANHGTVSNSNPLLKTVIDNLILTVQDLDNRSLEDATWLAHDPLQTRHYNSEGDAWKMDNGSGVPNIWTEHQNKRFAVNAFDLMDGAPIPLGFSSSKVGERFQIHLEQVTDGSTYGGILEDVITGTFTDLNQGNYVFTHHDFVGPRFFLHPTRGLATEDIESNPAALGMYYVNGQLNFTQMLDEISIVNIFSSSGQLIACHKEQTGNPIFIELASGIYTATVVSPARATSLKFQVIR